MALVSPDHEGICRIGPETHRFLQTTTPKLIYSRTKNLRAVQLLLGHTKLDSTVSALVLNWMMFWI
jgi:site-specific recombinase XerC